MEKQNNEFSELLCNLYLTVLLFALPLYTGQGYWQLGDTKYKLFYNVTLLCLGCGLAAGVFTGLQTAAGKIGEWSKTGKKRNKTGAKRRWRVKAGISGLDLVVIAYGICVLLSALCSSYGKLAWFGYEGWYMGAVSQLLFTGIYFFVSRQYKGAFWPLYLGEIALTVTAGLGLLHRLGIDPLGLQQGWNSGDWEYSHMLSTLGNINWLCGYYSVALAFLTIHYLLEERRWLRVLLYLAEVCVFVLLGIQGSQSGLLLLAVCAVTVFWLGRRRREIQRRFILALAGFCVSMPLMWSLMKMRGEKAAIPADGNIFDHVEWYIWIAGAAVCLILYFVFAEREHWLCFPLKKRDAKVGKVGQWQVKRRKEKSAASRLIIAGIVTAAVIIAGIAAAAYLYRHPISDGFGSGRGFLWRISLESFFQADPKDKLLGAGPDCYAEAVFNKLAVGNEVWKGEHWEGAVFTNAHNEILSQLCNTGILGTISYLAVFAAGFCTFAFGRRRPLRCHVETKSNIGTAVNTYGQWLGILTLAMYGTHALVSFQQVLSTPLLFLVLGICAAWKRTNYPKEEPAP